MESARNQRFLPFLLFFFRIQTEYGKTRTKKHRIRTNFRQRKTKAKLWVMVEKNSEKKSATRGPNCKMKTDFIIHPFFAGFRKIRGIFCRPLFKSQFIF